MTATAKPRERAVPFLCSLWLYIENECVTSLGGNMDLRRTAFDFERAPAQLTDILYGCLFGETNWQHFLDRLNAALPGGQSLLLSYDAAAKQGRFELYSGLSDEDARNYNEHYSLVNPWMKRAAVRPVGVGVISEQMYPYDDLRKTEFYHDYMRRIGCEAGVGITVLREDARSTIVTTMTTRVDPRANMAAATLLTQLQPHLRRVLNITRSHLAGCEEEQLAIFQAIGIGVLLVGSDCALKRANAVAQTILDRGDLCSVNPRGRFALRHAGANSVLLQMLSVLPAEPKHFSYTTDSQSRSAKVTLTRLFRDKATDFWGGPKVAVTVEESKACRPAPIVFSQKFRLTPAEARLTGSLLEGKSLKEAAGSFGVAEGTARQQLKSVFQKVGVSRQSELIRVLTIMFGGLS
ncbi:helix-turn-helix transcriptional regulator [Rhizobium sp. IBUN]|uniref:helix-turn-helix transcriptional regulator n=1 Tax=Rhizobium sp. IBUN TaxID=1042326 RepID=UPI0004277CBD|nr:helix-turn-helix transcriptional regulator [Rhizobium sp. IBUN]